ncbi:MAG TPA: NADH-quinone oxidoreductase subunit NuoK [Cyclobacteriaceae bacterium]|nr:NADH-quinone oxidoreductase subunit NuoK [Cyclobacteriaceae bacterium]
MLHTLFLSVILFSAGLLTVIIKRNAIMVLMGIELMLNAANLNLIVFNRNNPEILSGQFFSLFVIVVAVCETAVGLAIVLRVYKYYQTSVPDEIRELKD